MLTVLLDSMPNNLTMPNNNQGQCKTTEEMISNFFILSKSQRNKPILKHADWPGEDLAG